MISPEKIEQWVEEVQQRPASAELIIRFIANRLRDLSGRNEELLTENIALMTEKRVEEYEQRIAHLEYQLEVLKRQFSGDLPSLAADTNAELPPVSASVLVYNGLGKVLRLEIDRSTPTDPTQIASLQGDLEYQEHPIRLMAAPSTEELLYFYTSGRVATGPVNAIPVSPLSEAPDWQHAPAPEEPLAGEKLVCIRPISRIAVSDYFVQASRRGFVKKIGTNMTQSILLNRYLGAGVKQPPDEAYELLLCAKQDLIVLVSSQGFIAPVDLAQLPFSVVEAIRLETYDYITAALIAAPNRSLVAMTQTGKIVHRTAEDLEAALPQKKKGVALYSPARRAAGVRVVGAAAVSQQDRAISLHSDGSLYLHRVESVVNAGAIEPHGSVLAFTAGEF